jgi:hypothetical protein
VATYEQALYRLYLEADAALRQALITATVDGFERRRLEALEQQIAATLSRLSGRVDSIEGAALERAWRGGIAEADSKLAPKGARAEAATWGRLNEGAIEALARDVSSNRQTLLGTVLRQSRDYLRELGTGQLARGLGLGTGPADVGRAIREGGIQRLLEGGKLQKLTEALDSAVGVVYSDGSVHSLHAYGQMAARTGEMRAMTQSSNLRYEAAGCHLVEVSDHGTLCFLCEPLEGKTFALDAAGVALGYPLLGGLIPRHPNCQHSTAPIVPGDTPGEPPDADALRMTDRELYARMRDDVPDGAERMALSRRGWGNLAQARAGQERGEEFGPRYRQAGIEARRLEATRRVLESKGKLSYRQAMSQVTAETFRFEKTTRLATSTASAMRAEAQKLTQILDIPANLTYNNRGAAIEAKRQVVKDLSERLKDNPDFVAWAERTDDPYFGHGETPLERGVDRLVIQWTTTSRQEIGPVAMQLAAQEEFGLTGAATAHLPKNTVEAAKHFLHGTSEAYPTIELAEAARAAPKQEFGFLSLLSGPSPAPDPGVGPAYRAFLRAQYENTQEFLARSGAPDVITLWRGSRHESIAELGVDGVGKVSRTRVHFQPISSTAGNPNIASGYVTNPPTGDARDLEYGVLTAIRVPRASVLATPRTGVGCLEEAEFVLLGNEPVEARVVAVSRRGTADTGNALERAIGQSDAAGMETVFDEFGAAYDNP